MTTSCTSVCFGTYLFISLILYISQLALNGTYACMLYFSDDLKIWFLPYVGLLLLPLVTVQLVSAILLLVKKADDLTVLTSVFTAVLHILQLGFLWRHLTLFREKDIVCRSNDLRDFYILHLLHAFTSMIPLLLIQTFLMLKYEQNSVVLIVTVIITLTGSCWSLASFRKQQDENEVFTWPGTVFRLLWRLGEIVSRVVSLSVFATVYYYWIFLIIGLHGITMLVCLCTSVLGEFDGPSKFRCGKLLLSVAVAYMYSYCFINFHTNNSTFRYILYYVIMFFENVVLTLVWYISDDRAIKPDDDTILLISAIAFFTSVVSMVIYYKCFFHASASIENEKQPILESEGCINCKLSFCSKHSIKLQRPFSTGWLSQYQQALGSGNYYKNFLHDPLLDSEWESEQDMLNSSGEHCQIRDTDLESIRTTEKRQFTSVQASGTYTHKRFFNVDQHIDNEADAESVNSGSGVYNEDWRQTTPDNLLIQLSVQDSLSLLSSRTQLLTDSWDNLKANQENVGQSSTNLKQIDILNSLIRKDLDTSLFSDGYTTDHTLDSYQLPVTVLAKKRSKLPLRKLDIAPSTASECTDCTICAFMNQTYSSPESIRRRTMVQERTIEESPPALPKRKNDHNIHKDRSNRKQRSKSTSRTERHKGKRHRQHCDKDNTKYRERQYKTPYIKNDKSANRSSGEMVSLSVLEKQTKFPPNPHEMRQKTIPSISGSGTATHKSAFKKYNCARDTREYSESPIVCASDSGDSAFPRHTPLSVYLAAADNDQDGNSESSCEMII